ncbi:hypothetical protein BURPS668_A0042 [Burkholderia pseudomallei 668]|nr:hypothetical protein BURPS668_A0042 [Burkholderia pseudomallei 668]
MTTASKAIPNAATIVIVGMMDFPVMNLAAAQTATLISIGIFAVAIHSKL